MDAKPADEIELEERPNADADDDFLGTLPDVPKEAETTMREINLEAENTIQEINKFYNFFPDYKADRLVHVVKQILAYNLKQIG